MAEQLTDEQRLAIENRNGKLLVSAAAGSGKTKVLVDRLLKYITESNGKINIDDFLIITYTTAAAAELRAKIAAKLNKRLLEDPSNWHLQRQVQRLYMARISTVHSFCGDILREYAYRLDIPADFRIADEKESQLLQYLVLEKLMDNAYSELDPDILTFVDSQELKRDDRAIPPVLLQIYKSARCHLDPQAWLDRCAASAQVEGMTDVSQTLWGEYLINAFHDYLELQIKAIRQCIDLAISDGNMPKVVDNLSDTLAQYEKLFSCNLWDDIVKNKTIVYQDLSFPRKNLDRELAERIKAVRNNAKSSIHKKLSVFADPSERVLSDLGSCASAIKGLIKLVNRFSQGYEQLKHSRRVLDFSDLEHKMLELLWGKTRRGITALAEEIGSRFHEIMVDEYQDSNEVQDSIFAALTEKRQNCFMVGDVKQSIYQFRLADPNIFLAKYATYVPAETARDREGRKVMLSSNFRSAGPVIDAVNDVFTYCMTPEVGGLVYDDAVKLHEGIPHAHIEEAEVELNILKTKGTGYSDEANYVADRVVELLDGTHYVRDGEGIRPIIADDIAILLRSPKTSGGEFQFALESRGIRVNAASNINILETEEISFLRSLLTVIDNPLQDIPLIAVLTSRIFCFTADELALIRTENPRRYFFDSLKKSDDRKVHSFLNILDQLRRESQLCTTAALINKIFALTRMDSIFSAFSDGTVRLENLQIFYNLASRCEGANMTQISQFLDYLNSLGDEGLSKPPEYKIPGAVTILSIHKSKGLEYPVVFLSALSRDFSRQSLRNSVLCHRDLGIGLNCVDLKARVRYPSVARLAIADKIISDGLSEEMRVLYVAMTRAKDRLIMTYGARNPKNDLYPIAFRMDICDKLLLSQDAMGPGDWILQAALRRVEAGELFQLATRPTELFVPKYPWKITVTESDDASSDTQTEKDVCQCESVIHDLEKLNSSLQYRYKHIHATTFPSKQTATQLKGRHKDQEAAENTPPAPYRTRHWLSPAFASEDATGAVAYGNAVHTVMQHIRFDRCGSLEDVTEELCRMEQEHILSKEMLDRVSPTMIYSFFETPLGRKLCNSESVLREFKFSILDDAANYDDQISDDRILLQGVVDCALLESDGITVVDFKTDRVTECNLEQTAKQYYFQVDAYAKALARIYQKPVKNAYLYFFKLNKLVSVI